MIAPNDPVAKFFAKTDAKLKPKNQEIRVPNNSKSVCMTKTKPEAMSQNGDERLPAEPFPAFKVEIQRLQGMTVEELSHFAKDRISQTEQSLEIIRFQYKKFAVDLYWAGAALNQLREKCKKEKRGKWKQFLNDSLMAESTVYEAINLFLQVENPDLLIDLTITDAKERYLGYKRKSEKLGQKQKLESSKELKADIKGDSDDTTRNETEATVSNIRPNSQQGKFPDKDRFDQQKNRDDCLENVQFLEDEFQKSLNELLEEAIILTKPLCKKIAVITSMIPPESKIETAEFAKIKDLLAAIDSMQLSFDITLNSTNRSWYAAL